MSEQYSQSEHAGSLRELRDIASATIEDSSPAQRALAFGAIPMILLFVGTLPPSVQQQWSLQLNDPTVAQLYLSNFVHNDLQHLSDNIISYLLLMTLSFPLAVSAGKTRLLAIVSGGFLTVLPFIVSVYSLATLGGTDAETVVGFSGVNAAFAGALPYFLAYHANEKVANIRVEVGATSLFGVELSVVLWLAGLRGGSIALLAVIGTLGCLYAIRNRRVGLEVGREYEGHLLVYAFLIFGAIPIQMISFVDAGTNVFGHLIGLVGGFLLTLSVIVGRPGVSRILTVTR